MNANAALNLDQSNLPPTIIGISPTQAPEGTNIVIEGRRFGTGRFVGLGTNAPGDLSFIIHHSLFDIPRFASPHSLSLLTLRAVAGGLLANDSPATRFST